MASIQDIEELHNRACEKEEMTYIDPNTGLTVFTKLSHLSRGQCCGCGCRHCPWKSKTNETTVNSKQNTIRKKKKNIIYTKTGDAGTSSLFTGERVSKDDAVFEALGTIDELNSFVGAAYSMLEEENVEHPLLPFLERAMKILMSLGSTVATPPTSASIRQLTKSSFDKQHVGDVEIWIDQLTASLPDLRNFVLPFGGPSCSSLHLCRSICRRCERRVLVASKLHDYHSRINDGMKFLNRLSDFFFVAARYSCHYSKYVERSYKSKDLDKRCEIFSVPTLAGDSVNGIDNIRNNEERKGDIYLSNALSILVASSIALTLIVGGCKKYYRS
jgi:cob(I)alamin adenosyltransferase